MVCTTQNIPIAIEGELTATLIDGSTLFDYEYGGNGTLTASFFDVGNGAIEIESISATFTGLAYTGDNDYVGESSAPEVNTWELFVLGVVVIYYAYRQSAGGRDGRECVAVASARILK